MFRWCNKEIGGQPYRWRHAYDSSFGDETDLGVIPSANNGRILLDMRVNSTIINTQRRAWRRRCFRDDSLEPSDLQINIGQTNWSAAKRLGIGSWGTYWAHINLREQTCRVKCRQPRQRPHDGDEKKDGSLFGHHDPWIVRRQRIVHILFTVAIPTHTPSTYVRRYENDNNPASIVLQHSYEFIHTIGFQHHY